MSWATRWQRAALRMVVAGSAAVLGGAVVFYLAYFDVAVVAWVPRLMAWLRERATFPGSVDILDWLADRRPIELGATTAGLIFTLCLRWVRGTVRMPTEPPDPPPPPLPPREAWMVARTKETDEVVGILRQRRRRRRSTTVGLTTALRGAGGFGKTTLATMVCSDPRVTSAFRDRIYLVTVGRDINTPAEIAGKVSQLIRAITGQPASFDDPREAGYRLGATLDKRPPMLLVIDDVWRSEQVGPFLVGGARTARLVTSRIRSALPPSADLVDVDDMTAEEAAHVLTSDLPDLNLASLGRLTALTGRWPLLLRLVNRAIIKQTKTGLDTNRAATLVADDLQARGPVGAEPVGHHHGAGALDDPEQRRQWIGATIEASTTLLPAGGPQRLAELGVFVEDETIPLDLVVALWHTTAQLEERESRELCAAMEDLALITLSPTDHGTLSLHDEIRSYLRNQLGHDGLTATNAALIATVEAELGPTDALSSDIASPRAAWWCLADRYLWDHALTHLLAAGESDQAAALVGDLRWIAARLARSGAAGPARDLAAVPTPSVRAKLSAYTRATHLLRPGDDTALLVDTLCSRLRDDPDWTREVDAYAVSLTRAYLVSVWPLPDAPDPRTRHILTFHTGAIWAVAMSADGTLLAFGGDDGKVRLWDTAAQALRATLIGHAGRVKSLAMSADGSLVASAGDDGKVLLWDAINGDLRNTLPSNDGENRLVAMSADANLIGFRSGRHIQIWDATTGDLRLIRSGDLAPLNALAISGDGRLVAAASGMTIRLWDARTGALRKILTGHRDWVLELAMSANGTALVSASDTDDCTVRVWDTASSAVRARLSHPDWAEVAMSPDGRVIATGSSRIVRVWDGTTGALLTTLAGHTSSIDAVAISADATLIASASRDGTMRLWDTSVADGLDSSPPSKTSVTAVAVSTDGTCIASASGKTVQLWDPASGTLRNTLTARDQVEAVAISPDATVIVSASRRTVQLWDAASGSLRTTITTGRHEVGAVATSPDATLIAVASGRTVQLWNATSGTLRTTLTGHKKPVARVAISTDGTLVASAGGDDTVRMWNAASGALLATVTNDVFWVRTLAISADATLVATSRDTIRVWEAPTWATFATIRGSADRDSAAVAISFDLTLAASVSRRGIVRVWDASNGRTQAAIRVDGELTCVAWLPGNASVVVGGDRGMYLFAIHSTRAQTESR